MLGLTTRSSARLSGRAAALIKTAVDVSASLVCLVALDPLFLVISALVKLDSRGPVFFRHGLAQALEIRKPERLLKNML
jgi:lipopolysaccharide/colanic/teichoic acid biosynthesis glycosyltransferase